MCDWSLGMPGCRDAGWDVPCPLREFPGTAAVGSIGESRSQLPTDQPCDGASVPFSMT